MEESGFSASTGCKQAGVEIVSVVESPFFLRLFHDILHTPKLCREFVCFVLLTAALTYHIFWDGRPISAKRGPRFPKGGPISRAKIL